ncbi:cytochrome c [uncultured Thiohalocapsa sp.]|mgnify:CR=1 FL=1|uniref:cytochrome c n=1 Tax=uncultured Thiohalocapsa sp. TaxID=768990 RepID=UPI002600A7C8|nr:cytochrome c [uncultured Thiohalocapsa sp.]
MDHRVVVLTTLLACTLGAGQAPAAEAPAAPSPAAAGAAQSAPAQGSGAGATPPATTTALPPPRAYGGLSEARVAYGRYLTLAGDCVACHTREGGNLFEGGRGIDTPFGTIYTPNITPAKGYGIGAFSDEDFLRALQHGIRPDGKPYYPALPYPSYTKVKDDDLLAIKDYLFSLEPSRYQPPETQLRWPFDMRDLLFGWQTLYLDDARFEPSPDKSDEWNRGAYLVEGLGHCGSCHTPRNLAGATEPKEALTGAIVDGWYAPNLTSDLTEGLGAWSVEEIATYFATGEAPSAKSGSGPETAALGPMAEVVHQSLSQLAASDLRAMAVYLKDQPAKEAPPTTPPVPHQLTEETYIKGRKLYAGYCAGCHQSHGQGLAPYFPALAGNEAVTLPEPNDVIKTLLLGAPAEPDEAYSPHVVMPSFGSVFTDEQIATLASWIRASWGNDAAPVSADQVKALRSKR